MKQLSIFLILFLSGLMLKAQAPEKINYQAVARDLAGNPLVNQTLNVTYEIRQGSPTGTSIYTETHTGISTNQFGLFTTEIGGGTPSFGTFAGINWGTDLHYLYVEVNGDPMGSSQLLSVPYALYSKQAAFLSLLRNLQERTVKMVEIKLISVLMIMETIFYKH